MVGWSPLITDAKVSFWSELCPQTAILTDGGAWHFSPASPEVCTHHCVEFIHAEIRPQHISEHEVVNMFMSFNMVV